ncbi:MAG: DUF1778 domain-containing protein [Pseudomonadales bacterium]|nr:DUF1778 domain-containing protein [Pseudomonadales bacterium]
MSHIKANNDTEKGRITARVPLNVQQTIQKAAELTGVPMNAYMVQVVHQHALELIDWYEMKNIVLSERDSEWFIEQLANPRQPNAKLKRALANYKEIPAYVADTPSTLESAHR